MARCVIASVESGDLAVVTARHAHVIFCHPRSPLQTDAGRKMSEHNSRKYARIKGLLQVVTGGYLG